MLKNLSIKNFALIENCDIEFDKGLNIITGETGSGKSILIQALMILLGNKASVDQIRTGMEEAVLNALIDIKDNKEAIEHLKKNGILDNDGELLLRRVLTSSGKSRSFINGIQVTSKELSEISSLLFDFHGQHEGISLLKKQTHLGYLDNYLKLNNELDQLNNIYNEIKEIEESIKKIDNQDKDKEKKIELLKFEINEIDSANFKSNNEDEELKKEIKILENIEKLTNNLQEIKLLSSGEHGILSKLRLIKNLIYQSSELDSDLTKYSTHIEDIYYKLEDIISESVSKLNKYEYNTFNLDKLIERYEFIEKLKRKYGDSIEKIKNYQKKAKEELELINFSKEKKEQLLNNLEEKKKKYIYLASLISKKRIEGAKILEKKVKEELQFLGMEKVDFFIKISYELSNSNDFIVINNNKINYFNTGYDIVEFLISPNIGEPLKDLIRIASGGELSRIVLALKKVLAKEDTISTMIFDEIDVGIGGKVALSVARSLKELSKDKQIICITHLPQIASVGNKNFYIQKSEKNGRTVTTIEELNENDKIKEIARMLSGNITEISLNHSKELINSFE